MAAKLIHFYATRTDLHRVVSAVESEGKLAYARSGNYDAPVADVLESGHLIPGLGFVPNPVAINNPSYIVFEPGEKVIFTKFLALGRVVHSIEDGANPTCASFLPGGSYQKNILLYGRVATMHESEASRRIYSRFFSAFSESCDKVRESYVGKEAMKMLLRGARLTGSADASHKYDLSITS